jgi:hypothetical protein
MPDIPAVTLRAAAEKLRSAVHAASPGPWTWDRWWDGDCPPDCHDPAYSQPFVSGPQGVVAGAGVGVPGPINTPDGRPMHQRAACDAEYIALVHPGVGAVLADWLDCEARAHDAGVQGAGQVFGDDHTARDEWIREQTNSEALTTARAILGTPS